MRMHPTPRGGLAAGLLMLLASISGATAIASGGGARPVTPARAGGVAQAVVAVADGRRRGDGDDDGR